MQNFLNLKSPSEFWQIVQDNIYFDELDKEEIGFESSTGRILAENIKSRENLPAFDRSTVDGYAVKSADVQGVSQSLPAYLNLVGSIKMGKKADLKIESGETAYIPTGGMLPEGADCVIMVEHTENISDSKVEIFKTAGVGENIIKKGEEIKKDEIIFKKGRRIKARDIGIFAGLGITEFKVYRKPKVALISTGDELIKPDKEIQFGEIRDINTYTITSLLEELKVDVVQAGIIEDTYEKLKNSIKEYLDLNLVLVSGGSSAGLKDVTVDVINELGDPGVLVHGVKIKPGKPTILGQINKTPIMGLPGHPGSAWIITNKFVSPLIRLISGEYDIINIQENIERQRVKQLAVLNRNLSSDKGRQQIVPVKLIKEKGDLIASPLLGKSSFMRIFSEADGYLEIEAGSEGVPKGQEVVIYLFN